MLLCNLSDNLWARPLNYLNLSVFLVPLPTMLYLIIHSYT